MIVLCLCGIVMVNPQSLLDNANLLYNKGDYAGALKLSLEAMKVAKESKNDVLLSQALGTIGNIFQRAGRYEKALQFYNDALSIQEKLAEIEPQFSSWYQEPRRLLRRG